jgi:hypothetical protein
MNTTPRRPDPDDDEDRTPYGLTSEPKHVPPPIDYGQDEDSDEPVALERADDGPPRKKKRKKRRPRADGDEPLPSKRRKDILEREDLPPVIPWWTAAAITAGVGLLLTVVTAAVVAVNADKGGFLAGVVTLFGALVATAVEAAGVTAVLFVVGNLFGIDYGPVQQALPKLVAVVLLVNGVTLAGSLMCVPVGLVVGSLVGVPTFWKLFQLSPIESALSVGVMSVAAWVLAALVLATKMSAMMPK